MSSTETLEWYNLYGQAWGTAIVDEATGHPAKFSRLLIQKIYRHALERGYLRPGATVLDPFGGVASAALDAMTNGLNWIGVELEAHFVDMANGCDCSGFSQADWRRYHGRAGRIRYQAGRHLCPACVARLNAQPEPFDWRRPTQLDLFAVAQPRAIPEQPAHHYRGNLENWRENPLATGQARLLQGDSRQLAQVIAEAGAVAGSPPFGGAPGGLTTGQETLERVKAGRLPGMGHTKGDEGYGRSPGQLGNLVVVSSPPYATGTVHDDTKIDHIGRSAHADYGASPGQLDRLPAGSVEGVVSSPPFHDSLLTTDQKFMAKVEQDQRNGSRLQPGLGEYGTTEGQLGHLPAGQPAAVIASPPFSPPGNNPTGQGQGVRSDYRAGRLKHDTPETEYGQTPGQLGGLAILSSPPYAASQLNQPAGRGRAATERRIGRLRQQGWSAAEIAALLTPGRRAHGNLGELEHYGAEEGQLGVMKDDGYEAVVASPPFLAGSAAQASPESYQGFEHVGSVANKQGNTKAGYGETKGQPGSMVAGAISLPPYEAIEIARRVDPMDVGARKASRAAGEWEGYNRTNEANLGNLKGGYEGNGLIGTNVNSSRYGQAEYGGGEGQMGGRDSNPETFWSAARQIVEQVYQVLAPGGVTIWVTKDFVRDWQRVPFSDQWQALCQACGFVPLERARAWLVEDNGTQRGIFGENKSLVTERKSFFRRLAERRGSPRIDWEDVLILRKPI